MGNTQEKFLKVLKFLGDCREKLHATYNLYVARLTECKEDIREELHELYSQLLDLREQLLSANKLGKYRQNSLLASADELHKGRSKLENRVDTCMDDCDTCKKSYAHEATLCCDTYKKLNGDVNDKGYRQQVKLVRAILDKIKVVKAEYELVKKERKSECSVFDEVYNSIKKTYNNISKKVVELG